MVEQVLFNCDCMEYMQALPDKAFDLAIVDPPYGIGAENGTGDYSKAICTSKKGWDSAIPKPEYFAELFRVSANQIIWGANYFTLPPRRGYVCWYKTDEVKGRDFSEFELAWTSFDRPARHFAEKPFLRNGIRIHPTQKPVALYEWLLTHYAKPGQRILDTHLGSGSSAIAAYNLGFDFVGTELDADYHAAAVRRFEAHKAQGMLFQPDDYDRVTRDEFQGSFL